MEQWVSFQVYINSKGLILIIIIGWIRGIAWSDRNTLPEFLIIEFDQYQGPAFLGDKNSKYIPISPFIGEYTHQGVACKRIQFPIVLAYAITIHKCQGMTLPTVVVDIGKKETSSGLTFVAISRVRRIQDIAFYATYPLERL